MNRFRLSIIVVGVCYCIMIPYLLQLTNSTIGLGNFLYVFIPVVLGVAVIVVGAIALPFILIPIAGLIISVLWIVYVLRVDLGSASIFFAGLSLIAILPAVFLKKSYHQGKPTCIPVNAWTRMDNAIEIKLQGTDPQSHKIKYIVTNRPINGILSAIHDESGRLTYTPDRGFLGKDSFRYRIKCSHGSQSDFAFVKITVDKSDTQVY